MNNTSFQVDNTNDFYNVSKLGQEMIELWAINNGPMGLDHEINLDGEFKYAIG